MSEQATWIPLPRRRPSKVKASDAIERANRLAVWYETNKPEVTRISVTKGDYDAFKEAVGTRSIARSTKRSPLPRIWVN